MLILKLLCLIVAIWFWFVNFGELINSRSVPVVNILLASTATVGFLYLSGWVS